MINWSRQKQFRAGYVISITLSLLIHSACLWLVINMTWMLVPLYIYNMFTYIYIYLYNAFLTPKDVWWEARFRTGDLFRLISSTPVLHWPEEVAGLRTGSKCIQTSRRQPKGNIMNPTYVLNGAGLDSAHLLPCRVDGRCEMEKLL